jgi:two-component system, OmpR family, sensor histidine kinase MprB
MTFRARMVLATALVGVFAVLAASFGAYLATRNSLINSVDDVLQETANAVSSPLVQQNCQIEGITGATAQAYISGAACSTLPVDQSVRDVANRNAPAYFANIRVDGQEWREWVTPFTGTTLQGTPVHGAIQVAQSLTGVNLQLNRLRVALILVSFAALTLAVLLGWFVARAAVEPLNELTATVEELARTIDVTRRLETGGFDELGRLRSAFNRLLGALEASRESQHQLVIDASHELRTPLTSLRTNLEIVRRVEELSEPDREVLVSDVLTQMEELTQLVGDLAELARGDHAEEDPAPLRLDLLVDDAVALAISHGRSRGVVFRAHLEPTWARGRAERITRAVGNLLDNALKWSPDGGIVEVSCHHGIIAVRDHGPGIAPKDLPHIFDRFYRAPAARSLPGSGLGLAIVAQVAQEEGGSVRADNAPDGGALVILEIPVIPAPFALAN